CRRAKASSRFFSWVRWVWALITMTPSVVSLLSCRRNRRAFISAGKDEAPMSKRRWMAELTLLTFCPPAPWARMACNSISSSGMGMRALMASIVATLLNLPFDQLSPSLFSAITAVFIDEGLELRPQQITLQSEELDNRKMVLSCGINKVRHVL